MNRTFPFKILFALLPLAKRLSAFNFCRIGKCQIYELLKIFFLSKFFKSQIHLHIFEDSLNNFSFYSPFSFTFVSFIPQLITSSRVRPVQMLNTTLDMSYLNSKSTLAQGNLNKLVSRTCFLKFFGITWV